MGIIGIPREGNKRQRNSNSRGEEGSNDSKKSQVLVSPTHQPLQLLTAELAQKDISLGHSQFFQPAGNWTQPTDQKGNWFRGHGEVQYENYKDGQMKKKNPSSHSSPTPLLPSPHS